MDFEGFASTQWTLCHPCSLAAESAKLKAYIASEACNIPGLVDARLRVSGLSKLERQSQISMIPLEIKNAIPAEALAAILDCKLPLRGFGLGGDMGTGKTAALAAILKVSLERRMNRNLEALTQIPYEYKEWAHVGRFGWVSWPTTAAWMKGAFGRQNGNSEIEQEVECCMTLPLLILDDLGRERMRGAYTEDFAIGQLDRIVDARTREGLPILWTTNQEPLELVQIYGGAMMDRLLAHAPLIQLPKLPSLR